MDVIYYVLSKWIWFAISAIICIGVAYFYYARSPKTYLASATVIIKDPSNKTTSAGFDRYDRSINRVSLANEILQLQSDAVMREVVTRLHADVSYTVKEGLHRTELYTNSPVNVDFPGILPQTLLRLKVVPKADSTATVTIVNDDGKDGRTLSVPFGRRTVLAPGDTIIVTPTLSWSEKSPGTRLEVTKYPLAQTVSSYVSRLGIKQEKDDGSILRLSITDGSPRRAEDMLNTLIQVYNEEAIADKNRVAVNTADFIAERLDIIEKELSGVESDIESFKRSNQIIDITSAAGRYMGESEKYSAEAVEIETQLSIAGFMKQYLNNPAYAAELIPTNTGLTPGIESQITDYNTAAMELAKLRDIGGNNPRVAELTDKVASMRQSLIRSVDNLVAGLNVRRHDAMSSEMRAQSRVTSIPTKEREMLSLERKQKIKESLYLFLLNRREENALAQALADNNARASSTKPPAPAPWLPTRCDSCFSASS